jgi:CYTH domain-containing protein
MAEEIELELTYLAKSIPEGLDKSNMDEIIDIYVPESAEHPTLRIRKSGKKTVITKKEPKRAGDSSVQIENTIPLTEGEYGELSTVRGKRICKHRYRYNYQGHTAEIDVFSGDLKGLVLVDFEFSSNEQKQNFRIPDFCLVEVTQEKFTAGGMLCGKKYSDLENELTRFGYKKIETSL